ncbi:hypothetical protein QS306_09745 [Paraburkholderia bonniea]|uniref:hypothetical protein n=1 Tax=Paraburkholderia bonniea TaxID=2152891 RepID=UPI00129119F2|nr:hypothetical protein [Paraburkholderia bonniea]WJF89401.1 hypothetical protein QS306_09745 [Paraburkholderia bonniea]WJF92716.1 hypothetical protein QS308_09755 [Paraburkholderia bonniea]
MARPKIGLLGALVAVGGILVWNWSQKRQASQVRLVRELNRWEGEGGSLAPGVRTLREPDVAAGQRERRRAGARS